MAKYGDKNIKLLFLYLTQESSSRVDANFDFDANYLSQVTVFSSFIRYFIIYLQKTTKILDIFIIKC